MSQTEKSVHQAAEAAESAAKDTIQATAQSTRKAAANAVDKAQQGLKAVEDELNPVIDDLAARAQEWATRSINFCADSSDRARRQLHAAADTTTRYVIEQPGRSVLIAAAAGAAIATAFFMSLRSRK
ncbi:hypothetical protein [Comamonas composti]|uniref:hypothetical protein n=1 Tax=Comamonas composti TaxID=408558 RepID=UPI000408F7DD|nr:hypothetical protein [Comamonas composti]